MAISWQSRGNLVVIWRADASSTAGGRVTSRLLVVGDLDVDERLLHRRDAEVDVVLGAPQQEGAQLLDEALRHHAREG